jgi:hypothetical protein
MSNPQACNFKGIVFATCISGVIYTWVTSVRKARMRKSNGRDEYCDVLLARYKCLSLRLSSRCIYQSDLASPSLGGNASHTAHPDRVSP